MRIAVTDANIFIDMIFLEIHPLLLKLDLEIYTTQFVMDELEADQVQQLQKLNQSRILKVYAFKEDELDELSDFFIKRSLSIADHSVLFIATKLEAMIISGDLVVRKTCQALKIEVHGILWILDQCLAKEQITHKEAHSKLSGLMGYNKRLPAKDCQSRLDLWSKSF